MRSVDAPRPLEVDDTGRSRFLDVDGIYDEHWRRTALAQDTQRKVLGAGLDIGNV